MEHILLILHNTWAETVEIFNLATLNGRLFIPFLICLAAVLLSPYEEDKRARQYLVYPALILFLVLFNPVFIHIMYKFIKIDERICRIYWPLPIDILIVYCLVRLFFIIKANRKRVVLLLSACATLLVCSNFSHSGISYTLASNPYKLPYGIKEVCDSIYELNLHEDSRVITTLDMFYWMRQYNSSINIPYARRTGEMINEDGVMDLDSVGQHGIDGDCDYVTFPSGMTTTGNLEDYGYVLRATVEGQDCQYYIYQRVEG